MREQSILSMRVSDEFKGGQRESILNEIVAKLNCNEKPPLYGLVGYPLP